MSVSYRESTIPVRAIALACDGCRAEWQAKPDAIRKIERTGPDATLTAVEHDIPAGWNSLRLREQRLDLCPACTAKAVLDRRQEARAAVEAAAASVAAPAIETPANGTGEAVTPDAVIPAGAAR